MDPAERQRKVNHLHHSPFAPAGFEAPYTLALAELEEGVRVFTRMSKDVKQDEIELGMNVKLVPVRLDDERITYELKKA